ncbi:MAG: IS21-like element helper ATPase IstB [Anaerovoracaceae bacterium]
MEIKEMAKELKLAYLFHNKEDFQKEMKQLGLEGEDLISELLSRELARRKENGIANRIRYARFTNKKYMEDFKKEKYDKELRDKFKHLETLKFIDNKENIILMGSPGCGKTHYATALGIKACFAGKKVIFSSVPNLVLELQEAMSLNQITQYKRKFENYDVVILDELGYVSFDKSGCEILFNLLSNRNDKGSIIITTNLSFERWAEVFKDTMLTGAIIDRLAHRAHILDMTREISYRIEDTLEWQKG